MAYNDVADDLARDPLTGVYTRAGLDAHIHREMARAADAGESLSLLVLDLDYLKSINDAFGHRRGDEVLVELVERIGTITRDSDLLFRTGGDEFVLAMAGTDKGVATDIARRLLSSVHSPQFGGEPPLSVSLSIGVATYPEEADNLQALMDKADGRAYEAKRRGRGQVVSDESALSPESVFAEDASARLVERDEALATLNRWLDNLARQGRGALHVSGPRASGRTRFLVEVEKVARLRGYMVLSAGVRSDMPGLRASLIEQWQDGMGEMPTVEATTDVLAQGIGKAIAGGNHTGMLLIANDVTALDGADIQLLCHVFDSPETAQAGFAYGGDWARVRDVLPEGAQVEMVHIQALSPQGLRVWVRSLMQWECPPAFLEWLYRETGGLPGYVRKGLEYLSKQGLIRQRGNSWIVTGDVSGVTLREHLGMGPGRGAPHHNLPPVHYAFVGRSRETEEIRRLLDEGRLVTITGPGGMGKTHLAVHVASVMLEQFKDEVAFVPLAAIRDADLVAATLAQTLGVTEAEGKPPLELVKARLRDREMLLVMDNFEQVLEAAALVSDLLATCPRVKVLATSREALHIRGERVFELSPLAVPDIGTGTGVGRTIMSAASVAGYPAIAMFVQCAQSASSDFALADENAVAVAGICARLDGLPLAIELVAARIKLLSPGEMLARLKGPEDQEALRLLTGGPRDMPDRHRTMHAAIGWSYDLLPEEEKLVFTRLGVFAGGFTLDAAEKVVVGRGVLDAVSSLLDKSLLKRIGGTEDAARFGMLETIREYALERLADNGNEAAVNKRHAEYYGALAELAEPSLVGAEQKHWLAVLASEHDNMRSALQWARDSGEWETLARLASRLWRLWYLQGPVSEGRAWLASALEHREEVSVIVRAQALQGAGVLARSQGDLVLAKELLLEGLELWRELGDEQGLSNVLNSLGLLSIEKGRYEEGQPYLEESAALDRARGDKQRLSVSLNNLGGVAFFRNDYARATEFYRESLELRREMGDKWGIANSLYNLGEVAQRESDYEQAGVLYKESLILRQEVGDKRGAGICLDGLAAVALHTDQAMLASILLGAVDTLRDANTAPRTATAQAEYEKVAAGAREALGEEEYVRGWESGKLLSFMEAVVLALSS